jgi:hypothetical protein
MNPIPAGAAAGCDLLILPGGILEKNQISRSKPASVGAAEGCDLLILLGGVLEKNQIKRSQAAAAPTVEVRQ